jgi:hypothetical protein
MKAKVFRYKSDGNTVVAPYMETVLVLIPVFILFR